MRIYLLLIIFLSFPVSSNEDSVIHLLELWKVTNKTLSELPAAYYQDMKSQSWTKGHKKYANEFLINNEGLFSEIANEEFIANNVLLNKLADEIRNKFTNKEISKMMSMNNIFNKSSRNLNDEKALKEYRTTKLFNKEMEARNSLLNHLAARLEIAIDRFVSELNKKRTQYIVKKTFSENGNILISVEEIITQ